MNQTADTRGQSDEGGRTPVAIVKRDSKSKKKSESTSDATEGSAPVVPKKRRTVKTKHSPSQANLDIVNIAQDVVPLQIVDPTPADAAIKSPTPKRISRKRRLILPTCSNDESIATQKPVLEETLDLGVSEETQGGQRVDEAAFTDDFGQWLDDFVSRNNEPEIVGTRTFTEAEGSISPVVEKNLVQAVGIKQVGEEHMSIDDLLMQISEDMMLPSVTAAEITKIRFGGSIHIPGVQEHDLYYASLPRISIHDKGKAILEEDEPVRGNPARETVELVCGDVDFLVQLRDQVMKDVVEFFHSFSLNKLPDLDSLKILKEKEKFMLEWAETDSLEMAVRRRVYILAKYREMLLRKFLESHRKYLVPGQPWTATASQIIDLLSAAHSKSLEVLMISHWMVLLVFRHLYRLVALFVEAIDDLRAFILQRIDDYNSAILSKLHTLERGLRDTLHDQDANACKLINSICQDAHTISDVQKIHLNDVKKVFLAQGVTAGADSLEIRKEFKALDAKINSLDGQVAAIRNEQLEFQTKIAADILSLSTHLGDLVEYIRGGDAKKGEGSNSRRPLPTPVHQSEGTGDAVRLTEPTQADIDIANRAILERMKNEDRERERSRGSRSGSYKRRRF
ncbi:hypothetical protein F511_13967 [Dorcoceras hygrometricum]|uniref:Uncharacterized protein n=1 Tax=Dorcoceras hygrometricum TaxID=472368 RepID=A0A2Z7CGF7_9LAMI|nr:hypothetical protein F511_13967 [Dorcoceras hygrometricum]